MKNRSLLNRFFENSILPKSKVFILIIAILSTTLILSRDYIWKPTFELNQIADQNVFSPIDFSYKDRIATQKSINQAINSLKPGLIKDNTITTEQLSKLEDLLLTIEDVKQDVKRNSYYKKPLILNNIPDNVFEISEDQWENNIYSHTIDILARLLAGGIPEKISKEKFKSFIYKLTPSQISSEDKIAISELVISSFDNKITFPLKIDDYNKLVIKKDIALLFNKYNKEKINNSLLFNHSTRDLNYNTIETSITRCVNLLNEIDNLRSIKRLDKRILKLVPEEFRYQIAIINDQEWDKIADTTRKVFKQILTEGISSIEMTNLSNLIEKYLPSNISENSKTLINNLIKKVATPNIVIDSKQLEILRNQVISKIQTVIVNVNKGDLILQKGDTIDEGKLNVLRSSGLLNKDINWDGVYEKFSQTTIAISIFGLYLYFFCRKVFNSSINLWLITLMTTTTLAISSFLIDNAYEFIPLAVSVGILAIFINRKIAFIVLLFMLILLFKDEHYTIKTIIILTLGSITAIILTPKVNQRINMIKCGLVISMVQVISYISLDILEGTSNYSELITDGSLWLTSGIVFSMAILGILPAIEEIFGLLSFSRLTELADFNQPLLLELEEKAPGTFQHSLAVSSLVEYAARKIHLDSALCRVGCYYHDIGKIFKPDFYTENQEDGINPHDKLNDPYKSAQIIISHVKSGVVLAQQHKLPPSLIPFILEHHGTSIVSYFYFKAQEVSARVDESEFRYAGPRPQSKETAILMLADSSEAAVRSLKEKNRTAIVNKIKDIVLDKINDGQLSESGLTTDEISIIIDSFATVIIEIHHNRIEYPSAKK